jgi:hypothetical protein
LKNLAKVTGPNQFSLAVGHRTTAKVNDCPMPKKLCQRFKDSYQDTWNFICASKKGETFFHCTVCAIDIACSHRGKSDVHRHVGTKNHIDLAKVKQNCCSMKTFISSPNMTNSEIDLRKAVAKSETIMCQLIVNLNLPLSTADTFTKCFKQMFMNSKIEKGMT